MSDEFASGEELYRTFESGATRDLDDDKLDYEGFLSPLVLRAFAEYMHEHRKMPDGSMRASDNWQKGIPRTAYMKSMWRHFKAVWDNHRGVPADEDMKTVLCALLFNVMDYLHEEEKKAQSPREPFMPRPYSFPPET